ncbi:MAG TPA: methylated-DNA--[protein]-cysteine S-methyltransferase [Lentimicrobium sp.]|jgi:methylated-DNA-[protein]-cysteine S-methyltransferase|nr:methylated-DNA--[protein]-cysteine S-methyltransferase [Lentimicrobium sp.]
MASDPVNTIKAFYPCPLGTLEIFLSDGFLNRINFTDKTSGMLIPPETEEVVHQLDAYFKGSLKDFNLKIKPSGTAFQLNVWEMLGKIPYGTTITYGELSHRLGMRNGARAVGLANGANPIPLVIPCHRVIGAGGKLTGYGGGLWRKKWLLQMEMPERPGLLFGQPGDE